MPVIPLLHLHPRKYKGSWYPLNTNYLRHAAHRTLIENSEWHSPGTMASKERADIEIAEAA